MTDPTSTTWNITHKSNSIIMYDRVVDQKEFDATLAKQLKCSIKDATKMRKAFFLVLVGYLIKGHKVRFYKMGSFVARYRSNAWNFITQERSSSVFINMQFADAIKKVLYPGLMDYWKKIGLRKQVDDHWEETKSRSGTYKIPLK
jgi:nucleoid DNA-binding protein